MQLQLADRHDLTTKALEAKRALQNRVSDLQKDFENGRNQTLGITQDMTRQYKSMQEELLNRINALENTNTELRDQLGKHFDLIAMLLDRNKKKSCCINLRVGPSSCGRC